MAPKPKSSAHPTRAATPPVEPYLRFHHSPELRAKTLEVLERVEGAEDATEHCEALAEVVVELTRAGFDAYFMAPLKRADAGFVLQQSANLGMAGAKQVMGSVIRNILGRMDDAPLKSVCASLREFMA